MYAALARAVLDRGDRERADAEAARLRRRHPRASRGELADRVIRSTAMRCAAASLLWTGPAAFFGAMPEGPDLAYQIVVLNRLIHTLAAISKSDSRGEDRVFGVAAGLGAGLAADFLRRGIVDLLRRSLPRRPAVRALAGGVAGAALSFGTALAVGILARDVFAAGGASAVRRRIR
jgi:hypothetical protein